jgi:hypothetical protein
MWITSCLFALVVPSTLMPSPSWHHNYGQALARAQAEKKPVAVFIGSGANGWKASCQEGELSLEVRRLLAHDYVCVYIDVEHPAQQSVARSFEAGQSPLVVLSTRNGAYQAYRHSGKFANAGLAQALQRHASEDILEVHEEPAVIRPVVDFSSDLLSSAPICRT